MANKYKPTNYTGFLISTAARIYQISKFQNLELATWNLQLGETFGFGETSILGRMGPNSHQPVLLVVSANLPELVHFY